MEYIHYFDNPACRDLRKEQWYVACAAPGLKCSITETILFLSGHWKWSNAGIEVSHNNEQVN